MAVLVNPASAVNVESTLRDVQSAASAIGLQIKVLNASSVREINAVFATFALERPDAIFIGIDPFFNSRRTQLATWQRVSRSPLRTRRVTLRKLAG